MAELAQKIEAQYILLKDQVNLSIAFVVHANLLRTFGNYLGIVAYLRNAIYNLEGRCRGADRDAVAIARHQALVWLLRETVRLKGFEKAESIWKELLDCTMNPSTEMQTHREGVGYFASLGRFDQAQECLERAKDLFQGTNPYSSVTDLTILRTEIELSLARKRGRATDDDRDDVTEYKAVLQRQPNSYQIGVLGKLEIKCGMKSSVASFAPAVNFTPDFRVRRTTPNPLARGK